MTLHICERNRSQPQHTFTGWQGQSENESCLPLFPRKCCKFRRDLSASNTPSCTKTYSHHGIDGHAAVINSAAICVVQSMWTISECAVIWPWLRDEGESAT